MPDYQNKLYRAEQVRAMDQYAIKTLGISGTVLMERAGAAAFSLLQQRWPDARSLTIVCGTGNNGGDGFVVARLAAEAGFKVKVLLLGDSNHLQGDALAAFQRLQSVDIEPIAYARSKLVTCDLVVDAILGTGLKGDVSDECRNAIEQINQLGTPVFAIDIPSGINADSGDVQGAAVRAAVTLTFIGVKRGMYTGEAVDYCGEVVFNSLSLPMAVYATQTVEVERIQYANYQSKLAPRPHNSHKGHYGHVLIIGGETGYTGAVRMAGEAAARVGAGLVSIGTRSAHASYLNAGRPELMVHGLEEEGLFDRLAERATVIAIGPGLGQGQWGQEMLRLALESGLPLVVDADALNILSQAPRQNDKWILTPHCGEASRMLGQSTREIQRDRFAVVGALQADYGGTVILKGAGSLVASADGPILLCHGGNPGMASGGMGDVLTGIIAGLLAQGIDQQDAAAMGVCLHAAAGDAAARAAGERGLLASDLMSWVRRLANPSA
ncbi:MAG: NAD(P)H-hydrate dehydratase [Gammaproteobacteria bacterium]|jgi:ADP-dependent NAD(P)H-hydrate dehydratase / NAD(P)H-hydrate epimerase